MFLIVPGTQHIFSGFNFWHLHKLLLLLVLLFSTSRIKVQHLGLFLFIHVSFPSLVKIYVSLNYSSSDYFWHEQYSYLAILQRACLSCSSLAFPLPSEQVLRAALGVHVVQVVLPAEGHLQHCLGRVQSGSCVLRATLSFCQGSLCPKRCLGVENRAACSPLVANVNRKLLLPVAGPCWAQRPDQGHGFVGPTCLHAPLCLWSLYLLKTIMSLSTFIPSNWWNRWAVGWW